MTRKLPGFIVAHGIGGHRKMRRLTDAEFRCYVAGVLDLAGSSPERGVLLVAAGEKATAKDFAELAGVSEAVARSTLRKLRKLGTLVDVGDGTERVKNWDTWNPAPRPSETPEAWAERKRQQRAREKAAREQAEQEGRTPQLTIGQGGTSLRALDDWPTPPPRDAHLRPSGRKREHDRYEKWCQTRARQWMVDVDYDEAAKAIDSALRAGARDPNQVRAWIERHRPDLVPPMEETG